MLLKRSLSVSLALAALTAASAMAQTTTSGTTTTRTASFPPTGLGSSETAAVNVVNNATASSSGTAASCTGSISFFNTAGTLIGTATSFTLTSGQISAITLPFTKVGSTGLRTAVRAVISLTSTSGSGVPCDLSASFETYDTATGATHIHLDEGVELGGGGIHR